MKQLAILFCLLFIGTGLFSQSRNSNNSTGKRKKEQQAILYDSINNETSFIEEGTSRQKRFFKNSDTLTLSDYFMSVERVNDNLNDISDSSKLGFDVVRMSHRLDEITDDVSILRQNIRGRNSVINMKNLYLYQSLASNLEEENNKIKSDVIQMYNRIYNAKLGLRTVLNDSVFIRLYTTTEYHDTLDKRLNRTERKWLRTDSIVNANMDSLNSMKVKLADNAMSLSSILNRMDNKLNKAGNELFGQEVSYIWQKEKSKSVDSNEAKDKNIFESEKNAIGYYFSQTTGKRGLILLLGILLFAWLFRKRKLIKSINENIETYNFLNLKHIISHPILSTLVVLICLMQFFDAYAPSSYIAFEHFLLLAIATIIFATKKERVFVFDWIILVALFLVNSLTYLTIEPTIATRLWLLAVQVCIIVFTFGFFKRLDKQMPYYKWLKIAIITGIAATILGAICNLFGRFSLSGIFGVAGIFAITQAVILPVFINIIIEIVLLQLQNSRIKKGVNQAFDTSNVLKKIKAPLVIIAALLWLIMLTSNLNIYHNISNFISEFLTEMRTIGSITFRFISVAWFFAIIWLAHIAQRLIGFIFGETGSDAEDQTFSKDKHSRLLITKLLVLICGYILAIAASGLPLDKLTIVLGALGVGIGMGLQNIVNNFVSGIILIFDGSLKIGDQIEVAGQSGKVKEIGLRASTLNTVDGAEVIIPNGTILSQNIVNWTYSNDEKRVIIRFILTGKELDSNIINNTINDTILAIPEVIVKRKPIILYTKATEGTCWITVRFWSTINNAEKTRSEAIQHLNIAFSAQGIGYR
jgi:small-conductance mechanosensitive channel